LSFQEAAGCTDVWYDREQARSPENNPLISFDLREWIADVQKKLPAVDPGMYILVNTSGS
jgi:hypothetical protein